MSFKKFDGSTWQPITPKKLKGIPYTGTLPAVLTNTKAGYLPRYKIYGNTEQIGTPTPENPIVPQECGERTAQIFDISKVDNGSAVTHSGDTISILAAGLWYDLLCFTTGASASLDVTKGIFLAAGTYTIKIGQVVRTSSTGAVNGIVVFSEDGTSTERLVSAYNINNSEKTFTTATDGYISLRISSGTPTIQGVVLTAGSIAPSTYIPYGYKIPLASAGQTVDIYLDESQTTRKIAKIDLGTLNWSKTSSGNFISDTVITDMKVILNYQRDNALSDMFTEDIASSVASTPYSFSSCLNNQPRPYVNGTGFEGMTAEEFKEAMSGVYMYYVLATEETGTLNEPLRKIGNYADTIDSTQTTAQIPTSATSTTISWAGEGLAPSEFDSIQEWMDIPTYTYTNGAWVEDN